MFAATLVCVHVDASFWPVFWIFGDWTQLLHTTLCVTQRRSGKPVDTSRNQSRKPLYDERHLDLCELVAQCVPIAAELSVPAQQSLVTIVKSSSSSTSNKSSASLPPAGAR